MSTSGDRAAQVTEKSEAHKALARKAQELKDKGMANRFIAVELNTSESNVRSLLKTDTEVLPVGTKVEFASDGEGSLMNHGMILDHVPLEDGTVAYHIACYYVMPADMVEKTEHVEYAEPWQPLNNPNPPFAPPAN
jgi:DNA-binding CsgD family transcriptional regulator